MEKLADFGNIKLLPVGDGDGDEDFLGYSLSFSLPNIYGNVTCPACVSHLVLLLTLAQMKGQKLKSLTKIFSGLVILLAALGASFLSYLTSTIAQDAIVTGGKRVPEMSSVPPTNGYQSFSYGGNTNAYESFSYGGTSAIGTNGYQSFSYSNQTPIMVGDPEGHWSFEERPNDDTIHGDGGIVDAGSCISNACITFYNASGEVGTIHYPIGCTWSSNAVVGGFTLCGGCLFGGGTSCSNVQGGAITSVSISSSIHPTIVASASVTCANGAVTTLAATVPGNCTNTSFVFYLQCVGDSGACSLSLCQTNSCSTGGG